MVEGGGIVHRRVFIGNEFRQRFRGEALGIGPEGQREGAIFGLGRAEAQVADAKPGVKPGVIGGAQGGRLRVATGVGGGFQRFSRRSEAGETGQDVIVDDGIDKGAKVRRRGGDGPEAGREKGQREGKRA